MMKLQGQIEAGNRICFGHDLFADNIEALKPSRYFSPAPNLRLTYARPRWRMSSVDR